jgi:1-acyl-sn-glycerol-3-phosphate acyltransferase
MNHAAWFDPLVAIVLTRHFFPGRIFCGPMDAEALQRYGILRKAGLFGVEQGTARGAREFLRQSLAVLEMPNGALCLTPEGRFADVRTRPIKFQSGLGHIARRIPRATFVPMAVEYAFWEERTPELLVRFGKPIRIEDEAERDAPGWTSRFEQALGATLDDLAVLAKRRDAAAFETILCGRAGVGVFYDLWRRIGCAIRGERFESRHASLR